MKKLILILLIANCPLAIVHSQWVQQTLPVSGLIKDICFINQETGFVSMDTPALLKTTNGGENWTVIKTTLIYHIQFLDNLTGYAHGYVPASHRLYKTTNCGNTWDSSLIGQGAFVSMSFVNKDTGWICGHDGNLGAIWKTTNGGVSLVQQLSSGTSGMDMIFFVKQRYGTEYSGWCTQSGLLWRTTNSGVNWNLYTNLPNQNAGSIFFLNKDTGWVSNSSSVPYIMYTSNNGANWVIQDLLNGLGADDLTFLSYRRGWAASGFGNVVATTNSGINWGRQVVPIFTINAVYFLDTLLGWCGGNGICKTINGGGSIIYNGIQQIGSEIPLSYKLYQNYPNPFNPITNFKFQIPKSSYAKIVLYDILGRVIEVLADNYFTTGIYMVDFDSKNLPSGVYFYRLTAGQYSETKKMILAK